MDESKAEDTRRRVERQMQEFLAFIRSRGFKACPICGEKENFTWAHAAMMPTGEVAHISTYLPGRTTVPGMETSRSEQFPTPLMVLICDNCTHLMTFSRTHYLFAKFEASQSERKADPA